MFLILTEKKGVHRGKGVMRRSEGLAGEGDGCPPVALLWNP